MPDDSLKKRENWGSRIGVILAVSGSAVGLGNFLRFPVQAAQNGGGAFMIPYFLAFLLLGIPLAWVEWTIGRYGGRHGHGSAPGIYHVLTGRKRWAKYLGITALLGPITIFFYYCYIEGWTLAYAFFSLTGEYNGISHPDQMSAFLSGFQGVETNSFFNGPWTAYSAFVVVFVVNFYFIYRGVTKGIEQLNKVALPIMFLIATVLLVRVFTLDSPYPDRPEQSFINGLGFMWNPDFTALKNPSVWLAAAGQMFFTLSVGMGSIMAYASYLRAKDDVTLSSLTANSTNEFFEVILAGSIVIPATFIFFGAMGTMEVAQGGSFNLGFVTMPLIFNQMQGGAFVGFLWFFLLFMAGVTSSVSLLQPMITFLEDELKWTRQQSVVAIGAVGFIVTNFIIFTLARGSLDELDFWAGTLFPVFNAFLAVTLFAWFFGVKKGFREFDMGADLRVPRFFKFILLIVTPLSLLAILVTWIIQQGIPVLTLENVDPENRVTVWITRFILVAVALAIVLLIRVARRRGRFVRREELR
ncbi:sodium:calcium symporter [candidate division LCP-89 bacterium B3_LCP]|uniref:Sodium:calcium symporter n=1 Tax=candidate division LCP-89 bacterium B3_LCP TaxID=2012998 RepID=A0A532UZG8_UNCL8|nr:MAG: sodium:calcium symporter [candidate division LCP-89 bacterium B3_LCP]